MLPRRLAFAAAGILAWALPATAHADAIPPPESIQCKRGEEAVTDHGGTHCEYVRCATAADCPSDMNCVERQETDCDPRGEPCWTDQVRRCSPGGATPSDSPPPADYPGATPGGTKRSGCGCRTRGADASPAALALALGAWLLGARRRRRRPAV